MCDGGRLALWYGRNLESRWPRERRTADEAQVSKRASDRRGCGQVSKGKASGVSAKAQRCVERGTRPARRPGALPRQER